MAKRTRRLLKWMTAAWIAIFFVGAGFRVLADCSVFGLPFTDLSSVSGFCAAIAEAYHTGITNGTSATTFSPNGIVTRAQAAAFATRTLDAALSRGSRRAALGQWWASTPHYDQGLGLTSVGNGPSLLASDGADVWVANLGSATVSRVRGSDGKLLDTWTGATGATGVLVAMGRVFVTGSAAGSSSLYMIDPTQSAGPVTPIASVGPYAQGIAFDGDNIWTANFGGSISIVVPGTWSVTTVASGFSDPEGILFDGRNIWVSDFGAGALLKLDSDGGIIQTVTLGFGGVNHPVFDGHNIWVPNQGDNSLTVVRASDGAILKTFSPDNGDANGLSTPTQAGFDGQRILVTNQSAGLSLFNSTDLSSAGNLSIPGLIQPYGVCSDGVNFWVSDLSSGYVGRF